MFFNGRKTRKVSQKKTKHLWGKRRLRHWKRWFLTCPQGHRVPTSSIKANLFGKKLNFARLLGSSKRCLFWQKQSHWMVWWRTTVQHFKAKNNMTNEKCVNAVQLDFMGPFESTEELRERGRDVKDSCCDLRGWKSSWSLVHLFISSFSKGS